MIFSFVFWNVKDSTNRVAIAEDNNDTTVKIISNVFLIETFFIVVILLDLIIIKSFL